MTMKLLGVLLIVAAAFADDDGDDFLKDAVRFLDECGSKSLSLCFKERALIYMEQLPNNIEVGGTFIVKQNEDDRSGRRLNEVTLPEEPRAREEMLDTALMNRLYDYIGSHTFQFKIPSESIQEFKRSFEEEGRKKKKKGQLPLMLLFQMKAAIIGAMMLKFIGLVAFKALLLAKIALTIASVIGLKKLLDHKHHSSTYEVVAHPHYQEEHGHFDRSFNAAQELAYKGYQTTKPASETN